jgi:hypothetical protein
MCRSSLPNIKLPRNLISFRKSSREAPPWFAGPCRYRRGLDVVGRARRRFYAGKTVRLIIGTTTAGDYGLYARCGAPHSWR